MAVGISCSGTPLVDLGMGNVYTTYTATAEAPSSTSSTSSIPHLPVKSSLASSNSSSARNTSKATVPASTNSVLEKFKLFNPKDKTATVERNKGASNNKRTSSSSGFSSARSERSDSSTSICSESKKRDSNPTDSANSSSPTSPTSRPPQVGPPKGQVNKKIGGIATNKQGVPKPRVSDGQKDPISSKLEQLKATSKIAKEKKNEKAAAKSLENLQSNNHTGDKKSSIQTPDNGLKFHPSKNNSLNNSRSVTEELKTVSEICPQLNPDNPIRQSKIVANLTDKTSSVSLRGSSVSLASDVNIIDEASNNQSSVPLSSSMENTSNGQVISSPNSSIPKPTLAVKGTTKVIKEDKRSQHSGSDPNLTNTSPPKNRKLSSQDPRAGTKLSREDIYVAVHIAGPDTQVLDTGQKQSSSTEKMSFTKTDRARSEGRSGTGVSIAMVSPIMNNNLSKDNKNTSSGSLNHDDAKPPKSRSNSYKMADPIYETCNKLSNRDSGGLSTENATIWEEGEDALVNIKPMQPIVRSSPYGYVRGLGPMSSPRNSGARMQNAMRIHSEYGETGRINSSRQFLASLDSARMYGAGMKRVLSGCVDGDYASDMDSYDMASGYLSDGEVLRPGYNGRADDIASGYLSEGGGNPVYSRKPIGRVRDSAREQRIINVLQDDRSKTDAPRHRLKMGFDDSSSVSSGVSDNFPDLSTDDSNLTGSSVSSADNNVYASLRRSNGAKSSHPPPRPSNTAANGDKGRKALDDPSVVNPSAGSSSKSRQAHVKKTDSSMQTETSAFHHVNSSSSWKKYLLQQQQQQQDAQSVKSDKSKKSVKTSSDGSKKSASGSSQDSHRTKHKLSVVPEPETTKPSAHQQLRTSSSKNSGSSEDIRSNSSNKPSTKSNNPAPASYKQRNGAIQSSNKPSSQQRPSGATKKDENDESERRPADNPTRKGGPKVKVCGGTQTSTADLYSHSDSEYSSLGRLRAGGPGPPLPKQYFMTTPGPGTGLKERVYGSRSILNGSPTPMSDYVMMRGGDREGLYSSWMRHSPSCGGGTAGRGGVLTEADSMESLSSTSSSIHAQIQHARANSLTHARLMLHQRELSASPRLSRSNSIRSTKSEKLASYMLQRSSDDSAYATPSAFMAAAIASAAAAGSAGSQPTSPSSAPQGGSRYNMYPLSPGTTNSVPTSGSFSNHVNSRSSMSPYMTGLLSKMNSKDDDMHGSALSLVSTSSSIYSTAEEKQAHEIRKLKRELDQAHEKVATLTSQLTTNVSTLAFFFFIFRIFREINLQHQDTNSIGRAHLE
ncbi:hypothetical protein JTE90_000545 [Oedothorax gibbosus]|uniref:Neuron navigator 2 n=1 Tax=Oedothorax gibbosus TaxID=931172 RepID=A0AAV6VUX8_9ARAC|nr:hypothetical protein JTE90_000545 [Oedothorax gibbosus]